MSLNTSSLVAALIGILTSQTVFANELRILEIKSSIPLSESENKYRDIYIYGPMSQIKPNSFLEARRKIAIKDPRTGDGLGEIFIPIGTLKVIALGEGVAVAREQKLFGRENTPFPEQIGFMTGDQLFPTKE